MILKLLGFLHSIQQVFDCLVCAKGTVLVLGEKTVNIPSYTLVEETDNK